MTKKNFTRRIISIVCASALSTGLAISSLHAGALTVYAEEKAQAQEMTPESDTAARDNADAQNVEPQPAEETPPEEDAEPTAEVEVSSETGEAAGEPAEEASPEEDAEPTAEVSSETEEAAGEPAAEAEPENGNAGGAVAETAPETEEAATEPAAEAVPAVEETVTEPETATDPVPQSGAAVISGHVSTTEAVTATEQTEREETAPEEDGSESRDDAQEASPALSLKVLSASADAVETDEEKEPADDPEVAIQYDQNTDIHSVEINGQDMIVFCMNSDLHWPHSTDSIPAPNYKQTDTDLTEEQEEQLTRLLYAGFPYNGFSIFQIVDKSKPLEESDFDELLTPPAWLRTDFPELGETQYTYQNVAPGGENAVKLGAFLEEAGTYLKNGLTPSGHTYDEIMATTFWRAAFVIRNYGYDAALTVYKQMSGSSERTVTQREAYDQTSIAVWYLMKQFGLQNNTNSPNLVHETLAEQLFNTAIAENENVLTAKPDVNQIQVSGSSVFVYDEATKLWKTGTLTLTAPVQHAFILSLPEGITTDTGSTVIRTGDAFVLMTSVKPAANSTASLTS